MLTINRFHRLTVSPGFRVVFGLLIASQLGNMGHGQIVTEALIHESVASELDDIHVGRDPWGVLFGAFESAAAFQPFYDRFEGTLNGPSIIDWSEDLVLYAIWPQNSNRIGFNSWRVDPDGNATLGMSFAGILPLYFEAYPSLAVQVPRSELQSIEFQFTSGTFGSETPFILGTVELGGLLGDFNRDGLVDQADIDLLTIATVSGSSDNQFDLNADALLDEADRDRLVKDVIGTSYGDANLDLRFDSSDLVQVLAAGRYNLDEPGAGWASGDWNGDQLFQSSDLVLALAEGTYEQAGAAALSAVPEPAGLVSVLWCVAVVGPICRRDRISQN